VDQIKTMIDQLSELSEDQLVELQTAIVNEFETVEKEDPTPQTVDAMTSLADMLDTVRGEIKGRAAAAEELAARAAEAAMRVKGEEDAPAAETPEGEMPAEEAPAETEEAPAEEAKETPEDEKKDMPMAASTSVEEASELSTTVEPTETIEATEPVAELSAPEEVATIEAEPVAEAAVAEEVVTEVASEATPQAELSTEPTEPAVEEVVAETPAEEAVVAAAEEVATEQLTEAPIAQEDQEAPVTAAVNEPDAVIEAPADRRPVAQASVASVAITAGADIPGYTAGSAITDMSEVAQAMSKRLHTLRRVNGGDGEQHIVASITTSFPEERTLTQDAESNWNKIQNVVGPEALVASGGHQAPFEVKYDIFGIGSAVRPIRDSLPRFQADRGGIRYIVPPVLSDYPNAVGVWTAANDSAETPSPSAKLSLSVTAASETTVATDAVTLQLQFGNLLTRAYPELIARHNELGLIQHAREAEGQILSRLTTLSTAVTTTSLIGMGRDYLVQLGRAAAAYRSRHRLEADAPLRVIAPAWIKDAMAADLTIAAPGDSTMSAYGEIDAYIASRGINMTWHLDDSNMSGAQSGSAALNEFYDTFTWYIFAEGTFLFLDGGTLDLGIIRDSTLVGTNDYKMFVETFEGVAKVGVESLKVVSTINVNGVAAALRDTTGGATAAAIEY
jgi:chemotaxis protein histidine kinase CheA